MRKGLKKHFQRKLHFSHEILGDTSKQKEKDRDIWKKGGKGGQRVREKEKGGPKGSWATAFDKGQQRTLLDLSLSYTLNKKAAAACYIESNRITIINVFNVIIHLINKHWNKHKTCL